jgi:DNA replication protein DnaC
MTKSEIYTELFKEYEVNRDKASHEMVRRKNEIYAKLPRIRQIEEEISKTGSCLMKIFYNAEDKNTSLEELRKRLDELKKEKSDILVKNGYSPKYLNNLYICEKCKDTGYVGNQKCHCFNQRLIEKYYELSNMGKLVKKQNFSTFDIHLFSDEIPHGEDMSPKSNMKMILSDALEKIDLVGKESVNLLFYGNSGLGKTFLCSCIAKAVMDNGQSVAYTSAIQLFEFLSEYKLRRTVVNDEIEMLKTCDLLIIDDLGTENVNAFTTSELFGIINSRMIEEKSTIISTNLKLVELKKVYSERFASRIIGNYNVYRFFGKDIRLMG